MKWMKSHWRKILGFTYFIIFIITLLGGGIYYFAVPHGYPEAAKVALVVQNALKTLCFSPVLTIEKLLGESEFWTNLSMFEEICMIAYSVVIVVAPLVNILFVLSILDGFLQFFVRLPGRGQKENVLVIGYNAQVRRILDSDLKGYKVHLWTEKLLSSEEERRLYLNGIAAYMKGFHLGDSKEECDKQLSCFNAFLDKKKIAYVLIVDDSDSRNIQYYMTLSSCQICKSKTIHFWVLCNEFENRNALQDYFEKKLDKDFKILENNKRKVPKGVNTHRDLRIFSFAQIQAEILFQSLTLHRKQGQNQDVHLLIVGGGRAGEQILLHAMNQAVISPDNKIKIDVIDVNTKQIIKRLRERFDKDYVKFESNSFVIKGNSADGELRINFWQTDVYEENFGKTIIELQKDNPYSYIAVCVPNADANLHCALEINKALKSVVENRIPLALRMTHSEQMKIFFKELGVFSNVHLMGAHEENIVFHQIINKEEEKEIRRYNVNYNSIISSKMCSNNFSEYSSSKDELEWNRMDYFQRQSNRALFYHQNVKKAAFEEYKEEIDMFLELCRSEISKNQKEPKDKLLSELLVKRTESGELLFPELVNIAKTEHRRFCYFHASEGWGESKEKLPESRKHDCLCDWEGMLQRKELREKLIYDLISAPKLMEK